MKVNVNMLLILILITSCARKKEVTEWEGMNDFHMIMAECYHPYADSTNIQPAMELAPDLAAAADAWADSPRPDKVNTDEVDVLMNELRDKTTAFARESDTTVLVRIHDIFHELQNTWYTNPE